MIIEKIDNSRIIISLDETEMNESYNTNYDRIGTDHTETEKVIGMIIKNAELKTGLALSGKHLEIEMRKYDNGCLVLITIKKYRTSRKYTLSGRSDTYTFFFSDLETLIRCINRIAPLAAHSEYSMILHCKTGYCLVLQRLFRSSIIYIIICDYCKRTVRGKFFAAAAAEHYKVICKYNAIKTFSSVFK